MDKIKRFIKCILPILGTAFIFLIILTLSFPPPANQGDFRVAADKLCEQESQRLRKSLPTATDLVQIANDIKYIETQDGCYDWIRKDVLGKE